MPTDLGSRRGPDAVVDNTGFSPYGNGNWSITFDPATFATASADCVVYHMTLTGPAGSELQVFINQDFYDTTVRGDINSWDGNNSIYIRGGQSLIFYWNSAATPAPKVTIWLRSPT